MEVSPASVSVTYFRRHAHLLISRTRASFPGPEPQLKGLYEPRLLPNYDPSIFSLRRAMLAQQDIQDTNGKLIAPWDTQVTLHPGTLVSIEATLIVYNFGPGSTSTVCLSNFFVQLRS